MNFGTHGFPRGLGLSSGLFGFDLPSYKFPEPYFNLVELLLQGEGVNNGTVITDSSSRSRFITRIGNVVTSTDQIKYGTSSLFFPATGGTNYLETLTDSGLTFGSGDLTFEVWVRFTSIGVTTAIMGNAQGFSWGDAGIFLCASANEFRFRNWVTLNGAFFSTTIALNTWYHVAATKVGTTARIWVNGIEGTSGTVELNNIANPKFTLGSVISGAGFSSLFQGYMKGARVTKGVARYTTNFNPETDTYLR